MTWFSFFGGTIPLTLRCVFFQSVGPDKQRGQFAKHMGVDAEGEPAFHTRKETTRERHGAAQTHLHKVSQPCYCSFILSD